MTASPRHPAVLPPTDNPATIAPALRAHCAPNQDRGGECQGYGLGDQTRLFRIFTGAVKILPTITFLHNGLQILLPNHPVLDRILDHGTDESTGHVGCTQ